MNEPHSRSPVVANGLVVLLPAHPDNPWGERDVAGMVGKRLYVDCGHITVTGTCDFTRPAGDWAVAWG